MKKLFRNIDDLRKAQTSIKKNKKKLVIRAAILVCFLLGVNAFAWFAYISKADFNFESSIVSWDVNFYENSSEVDDIVINVGNMYPGMDTYQKTIIVNNNGEIDGKFSFKIRSFKLFGNEFVKETTSLEEIVEILEKEFPFSVTMLADKEIIKPGDSLVFTFDLGWPYEQVTPTYYKLNDIYKYDPSVIYYSYKDGSYVETNVTKESFNSNKNNLFLIKDDADSFLGEECKEYKDSNPSKACFSMDLQLVVEQILEN